MTPRDGDMLPYNGAAGIGYTIKGSDVRMEKLGPRAALLMGAPPDRCRTKKTCGWGVFEGNATMTDTGAYVPPKREQWCATAQEASALARKWASETTPQ